MDIIYLTSARIPSRAANAVQTVKMCEAFAKNGNDVVLYGRTGDAPSDSVFSRYGVRRRFGVRMFRTRGVRGTRVLNFLRDIRRSVRMDGPARLYFARDIVALASVAHHRTPMIFEAHRSLRNRVRERLAFRYVAQQPWFRKLVVVSHGMAEEYRSMFPFLPEDRIHVVPGAADDAVMAAPARDGGHWRGRPDALQVGYVGHLYEGRGVELIAELARELEAVDFHLVGGTEEDVARWKQADTPSNFYVHGYVPHTDLGWYYQNFDALVAPYQTEVYAAGGDETSSIMSPLKVFEYMAVGKPTLCSDLPVLREVLEDRVDSLLVPPDDVRAWAGALVTLQREPQLSAGLGRAARQKFLRAHTWTARARSVLSDA
jgi:glycosyltransferase involved in cell wall biosynthesis